MKRTVLIFVLIIFLIFGCTLAPKYERPAAPVPDAWPAGGIYREAVTPVPSARPAWQDFIADAGLQQMIETALIHNRDLRVSALNVEKARAYYGIGRVSILPTVNATGIWYKERIPADLSASGSAYTAEKYSVNLGLTSWEIDFFGRIRSLKDNALEEYLASRQALRGSELVLVTTVAQAYLALAADREALTLVLQTLEAQEEAFSLIQKRYAAGMVSELDLRRAQSQVEAARVDMARYQQQIALDQNALRLLVGSDIEPERMPSDLAGVLPCADLFAQLPSEALLSRPDVLAAEHRLKAANANIGAARAAFFPRIALTTSVGTASNELSGLFRSGSGVWSFAPQITVPIFDARTWYAYDVAKLEKEIAVAQYEKSIQTAFREIADALAAKGTLEQQIKAQKSLVEALSIAYRLSEFRYEKGIDSYLAVLDAQRTFYSARQGLIMLRLARESNRITLYKTLGGATASPVDEAVSSSEDRQPLDDAQGQ